MQSSMMRDSEGSRKVTRVRVRVRGRVGLRVRVRFGGSRKVTWVKGER